MKINTELEKKDQNHKRCISNLLTVYKVDWRSQCYSHGARVTARLQEQVQGLVTNQKLVADGWIYEKCKEGSI